MFNIYLQDRSRWDVAKLLRHFLWLFMSLHQIDDCSHYTHCDATHPHCVTIHVQFHNRKLQTGL